MQRKKYQMTRAVMASSRSNATKELILKYLADGPPRTFKTLAEDLKEQLQVIYPKKGRDDMQLQLYEFIQQLTRIGAIQEVQTRVEGSPGFHKVYQLPTSNAAAYE